MNLYLLIVTKRWGYHIQTPKQCARGSAKGLGGCPLDTMIWKSHSERYGLRLRRKHPLIMAIILLNAQIVMGRARRLPRSKKKRRRRGMDNKECHKCDGKGYCLTCNGYGYVKLQSRKECPECSGSGSCPECDGYGYLKMENKISTRRVRRWQE